MRATIRILVLSIVLGCASSRVEPGAVTLEFRPAEMFPGNGLTEMRVGESGRKVYVRDEVVLSNEDVASASVRQRQGGPAIEIVLNESGREKLAEATALNLNKPLAILVNGRVLCAPIVRETVVGDSLTITGNFTQEEATRIAEGIVRR